jgi:dTDP-4-dehydrorhamnose reductase
MSDVLVLGHRGQVASALAQAAWPGGIAVECLGREHIDLGNPPAASAAIERRRPALVINAAAFTAVDLAESQQRAAFTLNRDAAGAVATCCSRLGIPLIHLSTDYVFDGRKQGAYVEDDPVNPLSVYGASKEAGEEAVRAALPAHVILRTSWVYAPAGKNFVLSMLARAERGESLRIVDDQWGCPTAASEIARAIVAVCQRLLAGDGIFGTFHFCGAGSTSWHGFARQIFRLRGGPSPELTAIPTSAYPTPARRPANSKLDASKIWRLYGVNARPWRESLAECMAAIAARRDQGA